MAATSIEWTDKVWNPVRGCSLVSHGCTNCYAMKQAHRFPAYAGLTKMTSHGPVWTGEVRTAPEMLDAPLRWRKPARIFVNSMSDLFHEDIPDDFIAAVFGVMAASPHHTYQVLTKRPARMLAWFTWHYAEARLYAQWEPWRVCESAAMEHDVLVPAIGCQQPWPLKNVWLGVSCEDQATADERIPLLLQTPAAVRFLSCEPLLGPIDVGPYLTRDHLFAMLPGFKDPLPGVHWVIVGGESGPGARPFNIEWARSIVAQCRAAKVPVLVKQLGARPFLHAESSINESGPGYRLSVQTMEVDTTIRLSDRKGGDMAEWPEDLRVRQYPEARI